MNQDQLRAALSALGAGAALADVGATLARLADPLEAKPRAPVSSPLRCCRSEAATPKVRPDAGDRQGRSSEPPARASLTRAAMQVSRTDDGVAEVQARTNLATTPIYSLHDLLTHAASTDPAHTYRLDGCRIEIIGRRACCGADHRRAAARRRAAVNKSNGGRHPPYYRSED